MPRARDILGAMRTVAVWLLVVSVFLGPVGIGAASASSVGSKACGVLCPCDDEPRQADHHDDCDEQSAVDVDPCADDEAAHEHDGGSPDDQACFDECSGCAPGVALATAAVLLAAAPASSPELALTPSDAQAAGVCTGVFRPPRSLV